jgi:protein-L-isoaspartate(D-aspartate) O-methyltransferase
MNLEKARFNMVEQQIRTWEVLDFDALDCLQSIKRESFVPAAYQLLAFADTALPLGNGAAMWHPKFEAHALQALAPKAGESVLEVGTGSGFMAALLATHAGQVWSVEIDPVLATRARENLQRAGVANVTVEQGDGLAGLPAHAPFDAILLSGSVQSVPPELLAQLKVGGRLFAFVGTAPVMQATRITRVDEKNFRNESLFDADVAPLQAAAGPRFAF